MRYIGYCFSWWNSCSERLVRYRRWSIFQHFGEPLYIGQVDPSRNLTSAFFWSTGWLGWADRTEPVSYAFRGRYGPLAGSRSSFKSGDVGGLVGLNIIRVWSRWTGKRKEGWCLLNKAAATYSCSIGYCSGYEWPNPSMATTPTFSRWRCAPRKENLPWEIGIGLWVRCGRRP